MSDLRLMDFPELYPEVAAKAAATLGVPASSKVTDAVRESAEAPGKPAPVQTAMEQAIAAAAVAVLARLSGRSVAAAKAPEVQAAPVVEPKPIKKK